jgi:putative DNA primase/helicase
LEDRSIKIEMRRKLRSEIVERIPSRDNAYEDLRRKCARWAADNFDKLKNANPQVPRDMSDRARDNWELLLAIAEVAGGKWPAWGARAARKLSEANDDETFAIVLLRDLKEMFEQDRVDALSSKDIVDALAAKEDRP